MGSTLTATFSLGTFGASQMIDCGTLLRQSGLGITSMEEAANRLVDVFADRFLDFQGQPEFALVRVYRTISARRLPPELRAKVKGPDEMKCLSLLATRGLEPAWCDRRQSSGHSAIGLPDPGFVSAVPMLARLFESFGIEVEALLGGGILLNASDENRRFNVFHVETAPGSPFIPAQDHFVLPFGVKSVVGFGGSLPDGDIYAVIGFARVPVSREVAERFNTLTLHSRIPLLVHCLGPVFAEDARPEVDELEQLRQKVRAYEELIDEHELRVRQQSVAIEDRNRDMRLVLENVGQGFLILDRSGAVGPERSAIVERWLGPLPRADKFWDSVSRVDQAFADQFQMGWECLIEDILPMDLCLFQMPQSFGCGEKTLKVNYTPVLDRDGALAQVVLVITDISTEIAATRAREQQAEIAQLFARALTDTRVILDFVEETDVRLLHLMQEQLDFHEAMRELHTIKGNCALHGLESMANSAHALEDKLIDLGCTPTLEDLEPLHARWSLLTEALRAVFSQERSFSEVTPHEIEGLIELVRTDPNPERVTNVLSSWLQEPANRRLIHAKAQIQALGLRLGKGALEVDVDSADIRVPQALWRPIWATLTHVIRNAVDHGIEAPEERAAAGKADPGHIGISLSRQNGQLVLSVADDGRGIDWDKARSKAQELGAPVEDLLELLFRDGFSTRDEATAISGRGTGLGAFRGAVEAAGGKVTLESAPNVGTTVRALVPWH